MWAQNSSSSQGLLTIDRCWEMDSHTSNRLWERKTNHVLLVKGTKDTKFEWEQEVGGGGRGGRRGLF